MMIHNISFEECILHQLLKPEFFRVLAIYKSQSSFVNRKLMKSEKNQTKTIPENGFTLLLSKKYKKEFHLIDSPAVSYSLALKSSEPITIDQIKNNFQKSQPIFGQPKQRKIRKTDNQSRSFFLSLRKQIENTIKQIYKSLETNTLGLSEVFEYNQVILKGFLETYLKQLKEQCTQESDFLKYIWNQTLKLMENMIKLHMTQSEKIEKESIREILQTHEQYQSTLDSQIKKKQALSKEIKSLNEIINYLVSKLRIKRKQIKKLYRAQGQLLNTLNTYKDKTIDGQIKYLDLKIETENLSQAELQHILQKKRQLIKFRNQMLKMQQNRIERMNQINNELKIQGRIDLNEFIKEANRALNDQDLNSPVELQAKFDEAFDELQQKFQEREFKMKKITKNGMERIKSVITLNKAVMAIPQKIMMTSVHTETTYSDKYNSNIINSIGIMVEPEGKKKIIKRDMAIQCLPRALFRGQISQVLQLSLIGQETGILSPEDRNNAFKIKYIQKMTVQRQSVLQKEVQHKYVQCNRVSDSSSSSSSQAVFQDAKSQVDSQRKNQIVVKNRRSVRKSQFFRRQSVSKLSKNFVQRQEIKSRFSTVGGTPDLKRRNSTLQNQRKQSLMYNSPPEIQKELEKKQEKEEPTIVRKRGQISIMEKNRKRSLQSGMSIKSRDSQRFTSLSRKTEVKLPQNLQQILKAKEQFQENAIDKIESQEIEQKLEKSELMAILSDLSEGDEDSDNQFYLKFVDLTEEDKNRQNQTSQEKISRAQESLKRSLKDMNSQISLKNRRIQRLRQSVGVVESMINTLVKKRYKNKRTTPKQSLNNKKYINQSLEPVAQDVRKKIKECTFKTKKMILPVKHKNLMTIISSVLSRAWQYFNNGQPCDNFLIPLFQTMKIVYGKLPQQEIYKKVINFIAQTVLQEQKICNVFTFFLTLDEKNPNCKKITTFETYLFLKLIIKLSKVSSPFKQLDNAYTTIKLIQNNLSVILQSQNLPDVLYDRIITNLRSTFNQSSPYEELKLSLFISAKKIVEEILQTNSMVKDTFKSIITLAEYKSEGKGISIQDVKLYISCNCASRNEYLKWIKKLYGINSQNSEYYSIDLFISLLLRLKILSFQEFYIKILTKFEIRTDQAWKFIQKMKGVLQWNESVSKIGEYRLKKDEEVNEKQISQAEDIAVLGYVQKMTEKTLEKMLGKNLNKLYGISIIILQ